MFCGEKKEDCSFDFSHICDRLIMREIFANVSAKENFQPNPVNKNARLYDLLEFEKMPLFLKKIYFC